MNNQKIRIRLKAFDYALIDQSAQEIVDVVPCHCQPAKSALTYSSHHTLTRQRVINSRFAPISV